MSKVLAMEKNIDNFEHKLSQILLKFYEALDDLAYTKHEINAADIIDFSKKQQDKIYSRANGIVDSFLDAYQVAIYEFESLTLSKYRVPSVQQRQKIDEAINKLGKKFERLLSIIRAKAKVAIEDIEDEQIKFDRIEILKEIEKITFKQIVDSWVSGDYLFNVK